jgi:hypothetical protein
VSPEVWADAERLIRAGVAEMAQPVAVAWPNERFKEPSPPAPFLAVEGMGDGAEPYEIQDGVWVEEGAVMVHITVPTGGGVSAGLALRKEVASWFRGLPARPVVYERFVMDPGGADEDGNWYRLGLRVLYRYQDFAQPA